MKLYNNRPTTLSHGAPDFNSGHGEQFFRAFDNAYNLKPIQDNTKLLRGNEGTQAFDARIKNPVGMVAGSQLRSSRSMPVPARLFLSGNLLSLQDIGGQISMAKIPPNPPARRTEARRQFPSIRYELSIEGFSSCVPSYSQHYCSYLRHPPRSGVT